MKLILKNISAKIGDKTILNDLSLELDMNKITVLMGLNGSGKTTLANVIMGNPLYKVTSGKILIEMDSNVYDNIYNRKENGSTDFNNDNDENELKIKNITKGTVGKDNLKKEKKNNKKNKKIIDITNKTPDERARLGLFESFQTPVEVEGVTLRNLLKIAYDNKNKLIYNQNDMNKLSYVDFNNMIKEKAKLLDFDEKLINRSINVGFSGGEKKKSEMLQLLILEPKYAIIDEIDSGLDVDSLKIIANAINNLKEKTGFLIITHYKRILDYIHVDKVIVMINGKIVKEGSHELINFIEKNGYSWLKRK